MLAVAQALSGWFAQFDLPVYVNTDIPDEATVPYITIPLKVPEWDKPTSFPVSVWYRTRSNLSVMAKSDEIVQAVGTGVRIPCTDGIIVIYPDNPLQQIMVDGDYRSIYMLFTINAYHLVKGV